jgi:hypothetical protein
MKLNIFHVSVLAGLAIGSAARAAPAVPIGEWGCYQTASWDASNHGATIAIASNSIPVGKLWILDHHRYQTAPNDTVGVFHLEGDRFIGDSGAFQRTPTTAHFQADGPNGKPTIFVSWATAPTFSVACQKPS